MNESQIRAQAIKLQAKLRAIEQRKWVTDNRSKVGTCWKYRNCYSCSEKESDYWWTYKRIRAIRPGMQHFETLEFQTDKYGDHSTRVNRFDYLSGWVPCSEKEYLAAWKKFKSSIMGIKP